MVLLQLGVDQPGCHPAWSNDKPTLGLWALRPEHDQFFGRWLCMAMVYPLINIQKAIENGRERVDLPIKHGDFP